MEKYLPCHETVIKESGKRWKDISWNTLSKEVGKSLFRWNNGWKEALKDIVALTDPAHFVVFSVGLGSTIGNVINYFSSRRNLRKAEVVLAALPQETVRLPYESATTSPEISEVKSNHAARLQEGRDVTSFSAAQRSV